jgi:uncharacterized damage-inducible protein DinB
MGLGNQDSAAAYCLELLSFHEWRRKKISALLEDVDQDLFEKHLPGSFGSLYIILNHLVWAEKVWLGRVNRDEVATMKSGDTQALLKAWESVSGKWLKLAESANAEMLKQPITYFNSTGEQFENSILEIVMHLVDHSTYHIGQMMNAVRGFGIEPVSTNYIHYLRA